MLFNLKYIMLNGNDGSYTSAKITPRNLLRVYVFVTEDPWIAFALRFFNYRKVLSTSSVKLETRNKFYCLHFSQAL